MIKEIEDETKRAKAYNEQVKEDYYYDGDLGRHLETACWNVEHLLTLVKKQRSALETVLEDIAHGGNSFAVVVEALKES